MKVTSTRRFFSWRGFSLVGLLVLGLFVSSAGANHNQKSHISIGPTGGNGPNAAFFDASSADGTRAFFETDESLVSGDTDSNFDVYERTGSTTTLISIGLSGTGNGNNDVFFDAVSADGSRVFFETDEILVPGAGNDTDSQVDIYERSGGTTTLISRGAIGGNGPFDAFFDGISSDGSRVFFDTDEQLATTDSDSQQDVYERSSGSTSHVSTVPSGGNGAFPATFVGSSTNGTRVFFETNEALTGTGDSDTSTDIFQRFSSSTTRLSQGTLNGNGAFNAFFDGSSSDGTIVFFSTPEILESTDTDSSTDVYQRSGSTTTQLSIGPGTGNGAFAAFFEGSSQDGSRVFIRTAEKLVTATDTDSSLDIYERSSGTTTTHISTGPTGGNGAFAASFDGNSADGTRVFFSTAEKLIAADTDSSTDVYQRASSTTTQLSTGATGGNGAFAAFFDGASTDGTKVFLATSEKLEAPDTDSSTDIYERSGTNTTLLSIGPNGGNGAFAAFFVGSSQDGSRVFMDTAESLISSDTDSVIDVYVASLGAYPSLTGGGTFRAQLVPAFNECVSSNSTHGGPLTENDSCSNPTQRSSTVTMGNSTTFGTRLGFASADVCSTAAPSGICSVAAMGGPAPDVRLRGNGSDVVCKATSAACPGGAGSDYNPNTTTGPYTSNLDSGTDSNSQVPQPVCNPAPPNPGTCAAGADMTGVAVIPGSSASGQNRTMRITDQYNSLPSTGDPANCGSTTSCSATVRDQIFKVPVVCQSTASGSIGSYCGVNTTANALITGIVESGKQAVVQIGQVQVFDSGPNGIRDDGDDQLFAVQGIFVP